jgi:LPS-assembly protein
MSAIGFQQIKSGNNRIFLLRFKLTITFLIALIILISFPAAFAYETAGTDQANSEDVYLVQGKTTVIYKGAAPDAGDDELPGKESAVVANKSEADSPDNGNAVNIEADTMGYDNILNVYHARGSVSVIHSGAALYADDVKFDNKNNVATAEGSALLRMGGDTLRGGKIVFNVQDKTGAAYQAQAFYARNNFHVTGDKIEKTGDDTYSIDQPTATTCDGDDPDWQITGSKMKVTVEGYGSVRNACFRAKGIPLLYTPYLLFPAKTKRQTGFLMPSLAYSRDKDGLDIELPYFWAISPQVDATFYPRYIEKRGFKPGAEFRYYLGNHSSGTFYGDYIEDKRHVTETAYAATSRDWQEMHRRWSYYFNHQTNFSPLFYARADLKQVSDRWYFKDFAAQNYYRDNYAREADGDFKKVSFYGDETLRYLESTVRVFKGWSNYSLTGLINSTEDFGVADNNKTLQKYPEIVFTGAKQQFMSTPLYYELSGIYNYLYRSEGEKGHYIELAPTLSMPININNYVKLTPQFAFKETLWSRDDDEADSKNKNGDSAIFNASIALSSQISRVFDVNVFNWDKIRHEIKPQIIYSYVPDVSRDNLPDYYLPSFSPFGRPVPISTGDSLTEQNAVAWSLTNTLTTRVKDSAGAYSYLEFLRLKLFQIYDINEAKKDMTGLTGERRPFSDMGIEFDIKPHKYFSFKSRNRYNFYDGWRQNDFDLNFNDWRGDALSIGYRNTLDSVEEVNFNLKAVITGNIEGRFIWRRDLRNSRLIENTIGIAYKKQCWSMGLDYTETDDDVRFIFKILLVGLGRMSF